MLARCATPARRVVTGPAPRAPRRRRVDGIRRRRQYVVTSTLSLGSAAGGVALGASVADGVASLSSSARLCARCVVLLVRVCSDCYELACKCLLVSLRAASY